MSKQEQFSSKNDPAKATGIYEKLNRFRNIYLKRHPLVMSELYKLFFCFQRLKPDEKYPVVMGNFVFKSHLRLPACCALHRFIAYFLLNKMFFIKACH